MNGLPYRKPPKSTAKLIKKFVVSESIWFRNITANDMEAPIRADLC